MSGATVKVHTDGATRYFAIAGEVDLANADEVQRALETDISNQLTDVVVDLTDVAYLDSSGLRVLFALAGRLRMLQVRFTVQAPVGSSARRIVELSGIETLADLIPLRGDA